MPLHSVPDVELRDHCKRAIEGLEYWLRRLIDQELTTRYGANYLDAIEAGSQRVIRNEIAQRLKSFRDAQPTRYSRPIDAALLNDEIDIICKASLFNNCFKDALFAAFPHGNDEARVFLERLLAPRNALYHANPVSVHDAYRVLCYTTDVIESLKAYYLQENMAQEFNVPTVIQVRVSKGHVVHFSDPQRIVGHADFSNDPLSYLRCGDTISIEVEIDPSFDSTEYEITWLISNIGGPPGTGPKYTLHLVERFVSERLTFVCRVCSKKSWHKRGNYDDQVEIHYKVLPPV